MRPRMLVFVFGLALGFIGCRCTGDRAAGVSKALDAAMEPDAGVVDGSMSDRRNEQSDAYIRCLPGLEPEVVGSRIRLPPTGKTEMSGLDIEGDYVVYSDHRCDPPYLYEVYSFHIPTLKENPITFQPKNQLAPKVHGQEVIWTDSRHRFKVGEEWSGQTEFYHYDIVTGQELRLTNYEIQPEWDFGKGVLGFTSSHILYDSWEGVPVADLPTDFGLWLVDRLTWDKRHLSPSGSGSEGESLDQSRAAWVELHTGPGGGWDCPSMYGPKDVFVHEIGTDLTYRIEESVGQCNYHTTIEGDYLAWFNTIYRDDPPTYHFEVDLYRFSTGEHWILNPDEHDQYKPRINDGILCWLDFRDAAGSHPRLTDVYVMELSTGVQRRVTEQSDDHGWCKVSRNRIMYIVHSGHGISTYYLFVQDLVADGIMSTDGHVLPDPAGP